MVGATPRGDEDACYGLTSLKRVPQASAVPVPPQLPTGSAIHCASVHVCPMDSDAIQTESPA